MDLILAAEAGNHALGGLGSGGTALVLGGVLVAGTRSKGTRHALSQNGALAVGLAAGTAAAAAGQLWGVPEDLTLSVLDSAGVGTRDGVFGDVGMPAIALGSVVIVYILNLKARTAGVLGVGMATVFASAGGVWAQISTALGEAIARWAG
ncbi:hypothetical protein [Streptomyces youssoufiensis]